MLNYCPRTLFQIPQWLYSHQSAAISMTTMTEKAMPMMTPSPGGIIPSEKEHQYDLNKMRIRKQRSLTGIHPLNKTLWVWGLLQKEEAWELKGKGFKLNDDLLLLLLYFRSRTNSASARYFYISKQRRKTSCSSAYSWSCLILAWHEEECCMNLAGFLLEDILPNEYLIVQGLMLNCFIQFFDLAWICESVRYAHSW
jgi:hypothetical protein